MAMFPRFMDLPPEIRHTIWKLCLPRRVVQHCIPGYEEELEDSYPQLCHAWFTTKLNARPPVATAVCRESANIAHEMGRMIPRMPGSWLRSPAWVQPSRDLVMHWNHPGWIGTDEPPEAEGLFFQCEALNMHPSLMSEFLEVFLAREAAAAEHNAPYSPYISIPLSADKIWDSSSPMCHVVEALSVHEEFQGEKLFVSLFSLSLHIPRQAALESGLFGLLGDEPVQAVGIEDVARLRSYAELFREHGHAKEQEQLQGVFEHMLGTSNFATRVSEWKEAVDWKLLGYWWYYDVMIPRLALGMASSIDSHPLDSVWIPPFQPDWGYVSMEDHAVNEQHPWVIAARKKMWRIQPQVIFRWCSGTCHLR